MQNSNDPAKQRWVPVVSSTGKPLMPLDGLRDFKKEKNAMRYNRYLLRNPSLGNV